MGRINNVDQKVEADLAAGNTTRDEILAAIVSGITLSAAVTVDNFPAFPADYPDSASLAQLEDLNTKLTGTGEIKLAPSTISDILGALTTANAPIVAEQATTNTSLTTALTDLTNILLELDAMATDGQGVALTPATISALQTVTATILAFPTDYPNAQAHTDSVAFKADVLAALATIDALISSDTVASKGIYNASGTTLSVKIAAITSGLTLPVTFAGATYLSSVNAQLADIRATQTSGAQQSQVYDPFTGLTAGITQDALGENYLQVTGAFTMNNAPLPTGAAQQTGLVTLHNDALLNQASLVTIHNDEILVQSSLVTIHNDLSTTLHNDTLLVQASLATIHTDLGHLTDTTQSTRIAATTVNGYTPSKTVAAATTNATSLKGSAGTVGNIIAGSTVATPRYLKFYDKASAPTVGSDTPVYIVEIPGNSLSNGSGTNIPLPPQGLKFTTGIAFCIVAGIADTDATACALNDVAVSIGYI